MSDEGFLAQIEALASIPPPPAAELSRMSRDLLPALSWGALSHPNAAMRRMCLDYLDHLAVEDSAEVFVAALGDPVPRVRRHAIHALTCEACKDEPLCVDVVAPLQRVIAEDSNPKVRFDALRALWWRADADTRSATIEAVLARGDRELLMQAVRRRRRPVPPALRERADRALAAAGSPRPRA